MTDWLDVGDEDPRIYYTVGATPQTVFVVPFVFFSDADLVVYVDGALKTLATHYTVAGEGEPAGGTVTFLAPQSNVEVGIVRDVPIVQTTHIPTFGPLDVPGINIQFSKFVAMLQQLASRFVRGIHFPDSESALSGELASVATRKNKLLGFGTNGEIIYPLGPSFIGDTATGVAHVDSRASAQVTTFDASVNAIIVARYDAGYPLSYATYIPGTSGGPMAFQDAGDNWWQLDISGESLNPYWFGVKDHPLNDDILAMEACRDAARVYAKPVALPGGFNCYISRTLELAFTRSRWYAEAPNCTINFTGTGVAVSFNGIAWNPTGAGIYGCAWGGAFKINIVGNANCTILFYYNNMHASDIKMHGRDCTTAIIWGDMKLAGVDTGAGAGVETNIVASASAATDQLSFAVTPSHGAHIEQHYASSLDLSFSGCGVGADQQVWLHSVINNRITGVSQSSGSDGLIMTATCTGNKVANFFCEANDGADFDIRGADNTFEGCTGAASNGLSLDVSGDRNRFTNNRFLNDITIRAGAERNELLKNICDGVLTDDGTLTTRKNNEGWSDYTDFTPGMTSSGGAFTTVTGVLSRYRIEGKSAFYWVAGAVSALGAASGHVRFTGLPVIPLRDAVFVGRELTTGKSVSGFIPAGGNVLQVLFYDATFPGAAGNSLVLEGEFQVIA